MTRLGALVSERTEFGEQRDDFRFVQLAFRLGSGQDQVEQDRIGQIEQLVKGGDLGFEKALPFGTAVQKAIQQDVVFEQPAPGTPAQSTITGSCFATGICACIVTDVRH